MADFKNQQPRHQQGNRTDSPKPDSASKPGKHGNEERDNKERERDRASNTDQGHQDNARGDRNPGNFQNEKDAGRKGGQR